MERLSTNTSNLKVLMYHYHCYYPVGPNTPSLLGLSKAKSRHQTQADEDEVDLDPASMGDGGPEQGLEGEGTSETDSKTDNQMILRLLEEGEKVSVGGGGGGYVCTRW